MISRWEATFFGIYAHTSETPAILHEASSDYRKLDELNILPPEVNSSLFSVLLPVGFFFFHFYK